MLVFGKENTMNNRPRVDRFQKAHHLANIGHVTVNKRDSDGRITDAFVPGSHAKMYNVILRRFAPNVIETECLLDTGMGIGAEHCKGGTRAVCYHALATIIHSANENGLTPAICDTYEKAERRVRIGGKVYQLVSKYARENKLWLVVNVPPNRPDDKKHDDGVDAISADELLEQKLDAGEIEIQTEGKVRDGEQIDKELGF
jgi:hypothetical protein